MARIEAACAGSRDTIAIVDRKQHGGTGPDAGRVNGAEPRGPIRTAFVQEIVPSYRQPFFQGLARTPGVELVVFAGAADPGDGFVDAVADESSFVWKRLPRLTTKIRTSQLVRLRGLVGEVLKLRPEVVISVGNKGFLQNHVLLLLKRLAGYRMYLLQHAHEYRAASRRFRALEWLYFRRYLLPLLDGVILYTEHERQRLIDRGVDPKKLWFTNNTLSIEEIERVRESLTPHDAEEIRSKLGIRNDPAIVFLGRLVRGKQVEVLFDYFARIRDRVPHAQLIVVGDGPLRRELSARIKPGAGIVMTGAIYDERQIAALMQPARVVFLPGYSGLTVNHAFAYGVPFVTLRSPAHKPEIDYVRPGENGYLLEPDDVGSNVDILCALLTDDALFARLARSAQMTAERLTMKAMVDNVAGVIMGRLP